MGELSNISLVGESPSAQYPPSPPTAGCRGGAERSRAETAAMASKQMEEIRRKLSLLEYPRSNAPAESLLFAGVERYRLLEWLFFRYAPAHPRRISFPLRSSGSCDLSAGFGLRFRDSVRELTVCSFGVCVPEAPRRQIALHAAELAGG